MYQPDGAAREWVSIVAARLQGQEVSRSAFFDVVRAQPGEITAPSTLPRLRGSILYLLDLKIGSPQNFVEDDDETHLLITSGLSRTSVTIT
jgi:hypothetical protein